MQQTNGNILYLDIDDVKPESVESKFLTSIELDDFDIDPYVIRHASIIIFRYVILDKRYDKLLKTRY